MEESNFAAALFPRMDADLKNAFFTCYKTYGKVATKKLISCFQDPVTIRAVARVMDALEHSYTGIPDPPSEFHSVSVEDSTSWLDKMPMGPGVSDCVNNTCRAFVEQSTQETVTSLKFLEVLCGTAVQLNRIVKSRNVNVAHLMTVEVRGEAMGGSKWVD